MKLVISTNDVIVRPPEEELEELLDDYALPKVFYTSSEWTYFVIRRRELLDMIRKISY